MTRRDALTLLSGCAAGAASNLLGHLMVDRHALQPRPTQAAEIAAPGRPLILLKADDLQCGVASPVPPGWQSFARHIVAHNLKANLGLIGSSLAQVNDRFISFIGDLHRSGRFELWNHGYDHVLNGEVPQPGDGGERRVRYDEFRNTSFEYQRRHLMQTQELARARLGITLTAFGAPGNAIDDVTTKVVDEAADIKFWFFGNADSRKRIIPRHAEMEEPLGVPNFDRFSRDYERNVHRELLALQCHPHNWTETQLREFQRIIEFLKARRSAFVLLNEL